MLQRCSKSLAQGLAIAAIVSVAEIISSVPAYALTITQYTFGPNSGPSVVTPTIIDANVTATNVSAGAGSLSPINFNGENYGYYTRSGTITNVAQAVSNNSYFTFAVSPNSGNSLSLNFLSLSARDSSTPSTVSIFLRSSLDGFTNNIGTVQAVTTGFPTFSTYNFNLTAPAYQNITSNVTFRVYGYDANGVAFDVDNVTLDGVVIPTPVPFVFSPLPGLIVAWGARMMGRRRQRSQA
jgi:hypothetical protein